MSDISESDYVIKSRGDDLLRIRLTDESMIITATENRPQRHIIICDITEAIQLRDWLTQRIHDTVSGNVAQDRIDDIMYTWRLCGPAIRKHLEKEPTGAFWATPIHSSLEAFRRDAPPTVEKQIEFRVRERASGVRVIEGDGIMVEAWS